MPDGCLRLLQGTSDDLGAHGAPGVTWVLGSGHTPGHTLYLHTGQEVLFAGDAVSFIRPAVQFDYAADSTRPKGNNRVSSRGVAAGRRGAARAWRSLAASSAWLGRVLWPATQCHSLELAKTKKNCSSWPA